MPDSTTPAPNGTSISWQTALNQRLSDLKETITTRIDAEVNMRNARIDDMHDNINRLDDKLCKQAETIHRLENVQAALEGKASQSSFVVSMIIALASLALGVLKLFIK